MVAMAQSRDRVAGDHPADCRGESSGQWTRGGDGVPDPLAGLSCEALGHCYVVDVVESIGTLGCFHCDYGEYIGAWHPK